MECGLLGHRSTCNPTDWWPRVVDGFMFKCTFSKRTGFKLQVLIKVPKELTYGPFAGNHS